MALLSFPRLFFYLCWCSCQRLAMPPRLSYDDPMKEHAPGRSGTARCYLDWAATAMPDYAPASQALYGNPSSLHAEGRLAREALESARARCAAVLGVPPQTLYFTSGGTESNALVLHSLLRRPGKGRLLYTEAEHASVRENCLVLERLGMPSSAIGVEKDGRVSAEAFGRALEKHGDIRFAALMGVNNETGAATDIPGLVSRLRAHQAQAERPVHFHSDLVQALGKVPVGITAWDVDSASFSAHKLGGPRGAGLLYLKKPLEPLYAGGKQEKGIRPGTENIQGALALADILERRANPEAAALEGEKAGARFKYLIGKLKKISRCTLIPEDREDEDARFSPWILQARFKGVPGEVMVRALDDAGIAISTGSACSSSSRQRPVLAAMGLPESSSLEGVRISQGWSTGMADMDTLLSGIEKVLSFL